MNIRLLSGFIFVFGIVVAACGGGVSAPDLGPGRGVLGGTDTDPHSVRLADIHFDDFAGGSVPLGEITEEELLSLRDRIPPIDSPVYGPAATGDWLAPDDLILGYEAVDGQAYAYPAKILNFHEIVNDDLGGEPVLVSYCPLCRSGIVYDRRVDGQLLSFGNTSALYQSDLVMYDRETLSYWFQVGGDAIVGELTGARLTALPSLSTTWQAWLDLHPGTLVLSRDTGFERPYERDPFVGYEDIIDAGGFPFPVTDAAEDDRLPPSTLVVGVELNGEARAYPVVDLGDAVTNDRLGGERIVVFSDAKARTASVYRANADGRALTFELGAGRYVDRETESEWSLGGEALSGPLAGERLEPLPVRTTFWFAYVAAFPEAEVYEP